MQYGLFVLVIGLCRRIIQKRLLMEILEGLSRLENQSWEMEMTVDFGDVIKHIRKMSYQS